MYERIVVPLDGSELAEEALPYAREMASKFGSRVTLLRAITTSHEALREVVTEPTSATAPELAVGVARTMHDAEAEAARTYLRRIAESFDGTGIEVETEIAEGDPEYVIESQAKAMNASLIIMASHGRSGLARLLHGSVSDEIVRGSTVPIMLIRAHENEEKK